jgi:hypothetical protein
MTQALESGPSVKNVMSMICRAQSHSEHRAGEGFCVSASMTSFTSGGMGWKPDMRTNYRGPKTKYVQYCSRLCFEVQTTYFARIRMSRRRLFGLGHSRVRARDRRSGTLTPKKIDERREYPDDCEICGEVVAGEMRVASGDSEIALPISGRIKRRKDRSLKRWWAQ